MCMLDLRVEPQALDSLNFNQLPSSEIVTAIATLDQLKRKKHLQLLESMVIKYSDSDSESTARGTRTKIDRNSFGACE